MTPGHFSKHGRLLAVFGKEEWGEMDKYPKMHRSWGMHRIRLFRDLCRSRERLYMRRTNRTKQLLKKLQVLSRRLLIINDDDDAAIYLLLIINHYFDMAPTMTTRNDNNSCVRERDHVPRAHPGPLWVQLRSYDKLGRRHIQESLRTTGYNRHLPSPDIQMAHPPA